MLDLHIAGAIPVNVADRTAGLSHPVGVAYYNDSVYYTDSDTMVGVMALIL